MSEREGLTEEIDRLIKFINEYRTVIDSYVSDFFLKDLQDVINPSWWSALHESDVEEFASLLSEDTWNVKRVWSLSLLAFRASVHRLSLNKRCREATPAVMKGLIGETGHQEKNEDVSDGTKSKDGKIKDGQYMLLEHSFRRHVKPKKQHEIFNMSKALHELADVSGCEHIVDVGAGQGHLSRALSFGLGHKVTTIEAAGCHAPKARKFDSEVQKDIVLGRVNPGKKRRKKTDDCAEKTVQVHPDELSQPNHIVAMVDPNVSVDAFLETLQLKTTQPPTVGETTSNSSSVEPDRADDSPEFMLTGLHACGDLTPTMLRVFTRCPNAVALGSVACCYMKMGTESDKDKECGYPMSDHLKSVQHHHLSYEAREMACHFIDAYHSRLLEKQPSLKTHCYRAALQEIIHEKDPAIVHGCIKLTFKQTHDLSFNEYASAALAKLKLEPSLSEAMVSKAQGRLGRWKDVVAFYTLRLSLAPVVETLILLDRVQYLQENGISSHLLPIFDPVLSPRNFILLSKKSIKSKKI